MSECEYCKNVDTGDNYYPILEETYSFGFAGMLMVDAVITRDIGSSTVYLELDGCMDQNDSNRTKRIPIKFCPMCGRKF